MSLAGIAVVVPAGAAAKGTAGSSSAGAAGGSPGDGSGGGSGGGSGDGGGATGGGSGGGGAQSGASGSGGEDQGASTTGGSGPAAGSGGAGTSAGSASGGTSMEAPPPGASTPQHPTVPGFAAKIINGIAYAPSYAPLAVKKAIWAGNLIRRKPYIWGGGHASFASAGYDCSGSVSYVLHAAGLLRTPMDSSDFMRWGRTGLGNWITVYTNPSHAFVEIAGIRFDTSAEGDPHPTNESGPRWRALYRRPQGFVARHPAGF